LQLSITTIVSNEEINNHPINHLQRTFIMAVRFVDVIS